jgi:hypothetical protein
MNMMELLILPSTVSFVIAVRPVAFTGALDRETEYGGGCGIRAAECQCMPQSL